METTLAFSCTHPNYFLRRTMMKDLVGLWFAACCASQNGSKSSRSTTWSTKANWVTRISKVFWANYVLASTATSWKTSQCRNGWQQLDFTMKLNLPSKGHESNIHNISTNKIQAWHMMNFCMKCKCNSELLIVQVRINIIRLLLEIQWCWRRACSKKTTFSRRWSSKLLQ